MKTDKCYFKRRIREKVFNTKTGRSRSTWLDIQSDTTTTSATRPSSDSSFRGLGPLYQPKPHERSFKLIQVREQTFVTDPVTKETSSTIEHHNIRVYNDERLENQQLVQSSQPSGSGLPFLTQHKVTAANANITPIVWTDTIPIGIGAGDAQKKSGKLF